MSFLLFFIDLLGKKDKRYKLAIGILLFNLTISINTFSQKTNRISLFCDSSYNTISFRLFETNTTIEGYEGDSIIIESFKNANSCNGQNINLPEISKPNKEDSINITFEQIKRNLLYKINGSGIYCVHIKVPNKIVTLVDCLSECPSDSLRILNMNKLIKVSGEVKEVMISNINVSNGIRLNTKSDKVILCNISLGAPIKSNSENVYLETSGNLSISLKNSIKANFYVSSKNGSIFSDLNIKKQMQTPANLVKKETTYEGTLNNGGKHFYLRTLYGNILIKDNKKETK